MFMSPLALDSPQQRVFPDLAGSRILISGLTPQLGVDVARAFAEHKARLVLQSPEDTPEMTELGAFLALEAGELEIFNKSLPSGDSAIQLAQQAVKVFGGLDTVINMAHVTRDDMRNVGDYAEVEAFVSSKLLAPTLISRVAANRMRLMMIEGSILNIVTMPSPVSDHERTLAGIVRSALAALTRGEAEEWAREGIRINAIAPRSVLEDRTPGAVLASDPDIAALALHLASKKGRQLSGHVFDMDRPALGVQGQRR